MPYKYMNVSDSITGRDVRFCTGYHPEIKNVIFHEPATIVYWDDGDKTVVKCGAGDIFDPEKGLAMAISKKVLEKKFHGEFKRWISED